MTILCSREQSVGKNQDQDPAVAIVFQCECGKQFETRDEDAGRRARCPACQRELIVPQPKPLPEGDFASLHEVGLTRTSGKAIASFVLGLCSDRNLRVDGLAGDRHGSKPSRPG